MSPDITLCSPTKFTKKCQKCYRMTAKPDEWQSYANLSKPCQYIPESDYGIRSSITATEYNKRMDKIIAKGGAVNETLIALLDEANRFTIASDGQKSGRKCSVPLRRKYGR